MTAIETDYLIVGAGATGMAFADEVVAASDAEVVLIDRRHRPGGHWNDAYPFVRLHQPSAFYGVNSRRLGNDAITTTGPDRGLYERASAAEICDYYQRVLEEQLLPSGRVRFLGLSDYRWDGDREHRVVSRLTGESTTVRVRRKLVDATYLETSVPASHRRSFDVAADAAVVPPGGLVQLDEPATGYTVLGAGKTAMDTCTWLLANGVPPEAIRWIRPRDAWLLDRSFLQPLQLVTNCIEGVSLDLQCAADAESVTDLFQRLEDCGQLARLDPEVEPTTYRGAILSEGERTELRRIQNVIRLGRVRTVGVDRIELEQGSIPTDKGQVHVDCTAAGLRQAPSRPIFEANRITPQTVRAGQVPFNAALVGSLEAARNDDSDKNRLCPPNMLPNVATDWLSTTYIMYAAEVAWGEEADLQTWLERSRLNVGRGTVDHLDDPRMQAALTRLTTNMEPALTNLRRLMDQTRRPLATADATATP